eukprot:359767-Chlamydomonas_euryale.AAC.4
MRPLRVKLTSRCAGTELLMGPRTSTTPRPPPRAHKLCIPRPPPTGVLAVRLRVRGSDGGVDSLKFLADTLVPLPAGPDLPADQIRAGFQRVVVDALSKCVFPAGGDDSEITLPVVFE